MNLPQSKSKQAEQIINKFSGLIRDNIQKMVSSNSNIDAEDIAQEVKLKLWKILSSEKKLTNHSYYITRMVYSSVIDIMRKIKREREVMGQYENQPQMDDSVPDCTAKEEIQQLIGKSVDKLIPPRRKVIKLYFMGRGLEEIVVFLGWSKDKVRNLLYRGLADVKDLLQKEGIRYDK